MGGVKSGIGIKYDLNEEWNGASNMDGMKNECGSSSDTK